MINLWDTIKDDVVFNAIGTKDIYRPAKALVARNAKLLLTEPMKKKMQLNFSDLALSQLCTKLNIPVRYMRKCIEDGEDGVTLFDDNLNHWLFENEQKFLLRTRNNDIRAVLSDKYSILDNIDIINNFTPAKNMNVKDYYIDDHYFLIRGIFNSKIEIVKRDPIYLGFNICNSEVGLKRLTIDICLWRQVCSNGLVIMQDNKNIFSQRHFYVQRDFLAENFTVALDNIQRKGRVYLKAFKESAEKQITIEQIEKKLATLPADFVEKVIENLTADNLYSVINTITDTAKILPFEQRFEAEKIAGTMLVA